MVSLKLSVTFKRKTKTCSQGPCPPSFISLGKPFFPQLGDLALKSSPFSLFSFFRPQLERHFFFVLFLQLYCDPIDRK